MFRALTRTAVTAALLWGHVAAEPHCATASDLVTPFDLRPSVVGVAGASEPSDWLLPRESLDSAPHDHSSSFAFPPLLQIPPQQPVAVVTEPVAAPSLENQVPPAATAASDSSVAGVILDAEVADLPHTDDDAIDVQQSKFALAPSFAELQALSGSSPRALETLPRLVVMTLLVLGTCVGTLLVGRRFLPATRLVNGSSRTARLQIVASLTVAPRSQLHIVRLDDREILVGVDARGLQQMQVLLPSFETFIEGAPQSEPLRAMSLQAPETPVTRSTRRPVAAA